MQVKENQPTLLARLEAMAETATPMECCTKTDKGRNRCEDRIVESFDPAEALEGTPWKPYLATAIRVTRSTLIRSAATGLWHRRHETAWYVASAKLDAASFAHAIRSHWAIENCAHYVRDVTMAEDASRIRVNPGVFARLRSFGLNILRANAAQNIAEACWKNAMSIDRILNHKYITSNQN